MDTVATLKRRPAASPLPSPPIGGSSSSTSPTSIDSVIAAAGLRQGIVNVQSLHTTAAIVVNEHEPLLLTDFAALLERLRATIAGPISHDDESHRTVNLAPGERAERSCALSGAAARHLGLSQRRVGGRLHLGVWQRVFLVELDGPRRREVSIVAVGTLRRGAPAMKVKMILPALTEATSPFFRPIKYSLFPPLGLATLAAYLDDDDEVEIQDEHVERLRLDDEPDLVVIQVYITSAYRAYELADHYRARGAYVVLGGLHVTSLPDEAAPHADTIFLGPGEDTWPRFLADFRRGEPERVYRSTVRTLVGMPPDPPRSDQASPAISFRTRSSCREDVRTSATSATRRRSSKAARRSTPRP